MKICPITYEIIADNQSYSSKGLKLLSPKLKDLHPLAFTSGELLIEAAKRVKKISVQGVQPKLSANLSLKDSRFELADRFARYILKPQHNQYPEVPQNEDLTMRLASVIGIEIPLHGLVYGIDGQLTYFIKRFDRIGHASKLAVEDFTQLSGMTRSTKYNSSMEKVVGIVDEFTTFPMIEKLKLFTRTIFNYLIGNEDMHLKNFSIITRNGKKELSPAYDLLNFSIIVASEEELALPLHGKKNRLRKTDLIDYFARERMGLSAAMIDSELQKIKFAIPEWRNLIEISFMSAELKPQYLNLLNDRISRIYND